MTKGVPEAALRVQSGGKLAEFRMKTGVQGVLSTEEHSLDVRGKTSQIAGTYMPAQTSCLKAKQINHPQRTT